MLIISQTRFSDLIRVLVHFITLTSLRLHAEIDKVRSKTGMIKKLSCGATRNWSANENGMAVTRRVRGARLWLSKRDHVMLDLCYDVPRLPPLQPNFELWKRDNWLGTVLKVGCEEFAADVFVTCFLFFLSDLTTAYITHHVTPQLFPRLNLPTSLSATLLLVYLTLRLSLLPK